MQKRITSARLIGCFAGLALTTGLVAVAQWLPAVYRAGAGVCGASASALSIFVDWGKLYGSTILYAAAGKTRAKPVFSRRTLRRVYAHRHSGG